jgi:hypothetical protein
MVLTLAFFAPAGKAPGDLRVSTDNAHRLRPT